MTPAPGARARPSPLARAGHYAAEYLPPAALLVALVAGWELWVRAFDTKPYVLPAPSRVWDAFLETRGVLPGHIRTTMAESLLGLFFAALIGVGLAVVIALVPFVRRVLYPLLIVSQTIPMIVLAPLLIVWFGFGMTPKVIVVALVGFFPIVVSTVDGLTNADRELVGLVRSMGARRLAVLRYVMLPSALPGFFAGLKIAAAYAVLGAVIGEYMGGSSGLGLFITRAQTSFRVDRVFVAVVVVALASMALFAAVHIAARLATPWIYVSKSEEGTK
ncbi:MAG: ABC transporter permease [Dehalococcoidia bacterium]|nr:ABC transporter permease [Dehalococcoidia bacterium]